MELAIPALIRFEREVGEDQWTERGTMVGSVWREGHQSELWERKEPSGRALTRDGEGELPGFAPELQWAIEG